MKSPRGEQHYCAKLTPAKAREIVRRYKKGGITTRALAEEYDVTQPSLMQVITGRSWSHATGIKFGDYKPRRRKLEPPIDDYYDDSGRDEQ